MFHPVIFHVTLTSMFWIDLTTQRARMDSAEPGADQRGPRGADHGVQQRHPRCRLKRPEPEQCRPTINWCSSPLPRQFVLTSVVDITTPWPSLIFKGTLLPYKIFRRFFFLITFFSLLRFDFARCVFFTAIMFSLAVFRQVLFFTRFALRKIGALFPIAIEFEIVDVGISSNLVAMCAFWFLNCIYFLF